MHHSKTSCCVGLIQIKPSILLVRNYAKSKGYAEYTTSLGICILLQIENYIAQFFTKTSHQMSPFPHLNDNKDLSCQFKPICSDSVLH